MIEHTTVTDPQDVRRPASRFYWQTVLLIFVLAAGLRGFLAVVNREANDDHYEVVKLILEGRTGLTLADCHECFHPKFFYYVCAAMIRIFGLSTEVSRVVAGQLLNSLAGLQSTNGYAIEQQHRTSVWTHLYARANFAQFEQHPSSWLTTNPSVLLIAKCSMVLGLLPLFFLLVGLGSSARRSLLAWRTWGVPSQGDYASLFCALVCCGYIAFIIKFTADYRDFAAMKVIYMLPGALPFTLVLAEGMQKAVDGLNRVVHTEPVVHIVLFCLVGLHCCGVLALVSHLADRL